MISGPAVAVGCILMTPTNSSPLFFIILPAYNCLYRAGTLSLLLHHNQQAFP